MRRHRFLPRPRMGPSLQASGTTRGVHESASVGGGFQGHNCVLATGEGFGARTVIVFCCKHYTLTLVPPFSGGKSMPFLLLCCNRDAVF